MKILFEKLRAMIGGHTEIYTLVLKLASSDRDTRKMAQARLLNIDPAWPRHQSAQQAIPKLEALLQSSDNKVRGAARATLDKLNTNTKMEMDKARVFMDSGDLEHALSAILRANTAGSNELGLQIKLEHEIGAEKTRRLDQAQTRINRAMNGPFPGAGHDLVVKLFHLRKKLSAELLADLTTKNSAHYSMLEERLSEIEQLQQSWQVHQDSSLASQSALELQQQWADTDA